MAARGGQATITADNLDNRTSTVLPARIAGGTGMTSTQKASSAGREAVDLERIRPGMSADEMQRVREEIVRVASQTLKGM